jgi:hypothetical protein
MNVNNILAYMESMLSYYKYVPRKEIFFGMMPCFSLVDALPNEIEYAPSMVLEIALLFMERRNRCISVINVS